jgi:hypothetical protein
MIERNPGRWPLPEAYASPPYRSAFVISKARAMRARSNLFPRQHEPDTAVLQPRKVTRAGSIASRSLLFTVIGVKPTALVVFNASQGGRICLVQDYAEDSIQQGRGVRKTFKD